MVEGLGIVFMGSEGTLDFGFGLWIHDNDIGSIQSCRIGPSD
jgi:hypothetical protein